MEGQFEKESRRGHRHGMAGKTVRASASTQGYTHGEFQTKKHLRLAQASLTHTSSDEGSNNNSNNNKKEWTVVESKGRKKKKKERERNPAPKLAERYTLVDPRKRNYDLQRPPSKDVPLVRTERKQFLVQSEISDRPADQPAYLGSGSLAGRYYPSKN
jgi:hypothetical protein